jgi:hypothetical protein
MGLGFGIREKLFRIPDLVGQKGTGSGSATLVFRHLSRKKHSNLSSVPHVNVVRLLYTNAMSLIKRGT